MILKMFSIRDSKAEAFNPPFYKKTHGEAERDLRTAVNDPSTSICQYPEDYDLYFIGEYDDLTGKISAKEPQHLLHAATLKEKKH